MEIRYNGSDGTMVAAISGKLDARTIPEFQEACASWPVVPTILDLYGLRYMSSSALRALLQLKRAFAQQGVPVVIAGSNGLVDKILLVSGFEQIFTLYPTVEEAKKAIGSRGEACRPVHGR